VSVRSYSGPLIGARGYGRGPGPTARAIPWLLAALVIALNITYPLVHGDARAIVTEVTVVVFALASISHAWVWRGVVWAVCFAIAAITVGFIVEALGVRSGFPFGTYVYNATLGLREFSVPVVIPLAWAMMAYPALVAARFLVRRRWAVALVGGWALATWDLFLDPMMVSDGHWRWVGDYQTLAGISHVPWTDFVGWLAVSIILINLLDLLPRRTAPIGQPALLYLWTYASSVLAAAVFFSRTGVAVWGGIAMGIVAVPYAFKLWFDRP
jgi:uncharacterized membrane protein